MSQDGTLCMAVSIEEEGKERDMGFNGTILGVEEMNFQFETAFFMTSCLPSNTMSSVGWYVENGDLIHMTYGMSLVNNIQEKNEKYMLIKISNYATYPMRGVDSISFQMPSSDVLLFSV